MGHLHTLAKWTVVAFALLSVFCHGQLFEIAMKTQSRCEGTKYSSLPVGLEKISYSRKPNSKRLLINGFIIVKKELSIMILELEFSRCVTEEVDSCLTYMRLNVTDVCEQIAKKNMIWSTLFNNTRNFPKKCPIPQDRYEMVGAYMNWNDNITLPPGTWKVKMKFFDREEVLMCYFAIATVKLARRKRT